MKLYVFLRNSVFADLYRLCRSCFQAAIAYVKNMIIYFGRTNEGDEVNRCKTIYFDVSDNRFDRHLYLFLLFLSKSGYRILLRHRTEMISCLGKYGRRILFIDSLKLVFRRPAKNVISLADKKLRGKILVSDDYFSHPQNSYHVPYTFHPNYFLKDDFDIDLTKTRRITCFFSGNIEPDEYDRRELPLLFGISSRYQVIKYIKSEFQTEGYLEAGEQYIVINDVRKRSIDLSSYLKALSESNFFLSVPGVVMPQCHNIVEGMRCGTIPITQYPNVFYPVLNHGQNCLVFSDLRDLAILLRSLGDISRERIEIMRKSVLEYYQLYLSINGVVSNFESRLAKLETLCLNAEYASVDILKKRKGGHK